MIFAGVIQRAVIILEVMHVIESVRVNLAYSLASKDFSNVTAPFCDSHPEAKDYYFDLPGNTVDNSAAVRFIRNPTDPWLEVSNGAVWNMKSDVDRSGKVISSSIAFSALDKHDQKVRPTQYNLKSDLLYMKKKIAKNGVMWVELQMKGCGGGKEGPTRPSRPMKASNLATPAARSHGSGSKGRNGHHSKRHSKASLLEDSSTIEDHAALAELSENMAKEKAAAFDDSLALFELSQHTENRIQAGKGKGRGNHGSKGSKGIRGIRDLPGARTPGRSREGRMPSSRANQECRPLIFADGTFYPQEGVKQALQNEFDRAAGGADNGNMPKKSGGWILPSQTVKNMSMAPALKKGILGTIGFGTLGFLAVFPAVWAGQEELLGAAPIGALAGALASAGVAAYKASKLRPQTASEKLHEKFHCLTKIKACNGEACFKQCHDKDGNEAIVPTHAEPAAGIIC